MNLLQVSDESEIIAIVEEVLADKSSERAISDLRKGNEKVIGFLVGQVMRKSGGKANPALVQKIIKQKIKSE
jgi:aspartyl-tRNA(Asn)/glutamyl-tRNA(Gln) amidotransferase subunit B